MNQMIDRFLFWYDGLSGLRSFLVRFMLIVVFMLWHVPWTISVRNGNSTTLFHMLIDIALILCLFFLMVRYWKYNIHRAKKKVEEGGF